jgi:hypothetical protein
MAGNAEYAVVPEDFAYELPAGVRRLFARRLKGVETAEAKR